MCSFLSKVFTTPNLAFLQISNCLIFLHICKLTPKLLDFNLAKEVDRQKFSEARKLSQRIQGIFLGADLKSNKNYAISTLICFVGTSASIVILSVLGELAGFIYKNILCI
jgi:hypothetical protein